MTGEQRKTALRRVLQIRFFACGIFVAHHSDALRNFQYRSCHASHAFRHAAAGVNNIIIDERKHCQCVWGYGDFENETERVALYKYII